MKAEMQRRASLADQVEALFRATPHAWIGMRELAAVGGLGGWRTRISELRLQRGMDIVHNGKNGLASCHMFRPGAIGREPDSFVPAAADEGTLFDMHVPGWKA